MVIATRASEVVIACWTSSGARTKIVSLVCDRDNIFESDAETLCALASTTGDSDLLTHARWLDVLGREAITTRFFRALEKAVAELADSSDARVNRTERLELALLYVSRLIFLSFLETKGWLNGDFGFLINGYAECIALASRAQLWTHPLSQRRIIFAVEPGEAPARMCLQRRVVWKRIRLFALPISLQCARGFICLVGSIDRSRDARQSV